MSTLLLAANPGQLDVYSLVMEAGPMAKLVLFVLLTFSVVSWGIMAERFRTFRKAERESDAFTARFNEGGPLATIQPEAATLTHSPVADVFRAGMREITLNPGEKGRPLEGSALEALDRMLRKSASTQILRLERTLGFLATTASATPFIGLFGTVWGIMNAFRGIGVAGTASLAAYAPGIAEALVATAAGLATAIPAVIGYNHFLGRLRAMEARIDEFVADFVHRVEGRRT
jgi:biopolymer transport protein TolQ